VVMGSLCSWTNVAEGAGLGGANRPSRPALEMGCCLLVRRRRAPWTPIAGEGILCGEDNPRRVPSTRIARYGRWISRRPTLDNRRAALCVRAYEVVGHTLVRRHGN
jgi:hypothetical protein